MPGNIGIIASAISTPLFNPVSDWSLPPLHAFSTADSYWIPPADTGSVSSWRNGGSAVKGAYIGAKGLVLPGLTTTVRTDCALIADSATLRPTGDLELIVKTTCIDWTPASGKVLALCGANSTHSTVNWYLYINTDGTLTFARPSGATARDFTSSAIGLENGTTKWIKVTFDQDNGSAQSEVKFYLSDDGSSWTQLGSTLTNATTSAGNSNSTGVTIGHSTDLTSTNYGGTIHRVIAKDGIGGTTFLDVDFETATEDVTSFTESSSNAATVTINSVPRAAHINANGLALNGNVTTGRMDCATIPDVAAMRMTGDMELIVKASATDWTPAAPRILALCGDNAAYTSQNWYLYCKADGALLFSRPSGATARVFNSSVATGITDGATKWIKVTYDQDNGAGNAECKFYLSDDGSSWTQLGTTQTYASTAAGNSNTTGVTIGQSVTTAYGHSGVINRVIVKDGIDGTTVLDADFESATPNVSQFTESSSNAATVTIVSSVDPVQATGSKQPTYDAANANYNNAPTVHFTTDDVLAVNITDVAQPYYAVVIGNVTSTNGARDVLVGFGGSTDRGLFDGSTATWALNAGTNVTGGTPDSNPHLFVAQLNSTLSSIEIDGIPIASSSAGTNSLTVLSLGAGNTAVGTYAYYLNGDIHTALIFQGDPRLQPEWADFEAYVESTTAIDVTPAASTLQAPTLLDSALYSPTNTCTSASISPTADSLLIITCVSGATAGTFAFSSTTLSNISSWGVIQQSSGNERVGIMWAKITGSAGTGTITITGFGTPGTTRAAMQVMEVVGAQRIRQAKTGTTTSATPSITLDYTPEAASLVIGAIGLYGVTIPPGANFTELSESNANRALQTQYDLTNATTTVDWSLGASTLVAMAAIEVTD